MQTTGNTQIAARVVFAEPRPAYAVMITYWEFVENRLAELRTARVRRA